MQYHQIFVTQEPHQEQTFEFHQTKLRLTLRYNSIGQFWAFDLYDITRQKWIAQGASLVCGVPILWRTSRPYFLWCEDESGANLDPIRLDDLGTRCFLYIAEKM